MQAGMRELLSQLDGSRASRIAMLAGMTRDEIDAVGGVAEDCTAERTRPITNGLSPDISTDGGSAAVHRVSPGRYQATSGVWPGS